MNVKIRSLDRNEKPPVDLLLLADPSKEIIEDYLERGRCYVAVDDSDTVMGAMVLLNTRPATVEIVNIAVREDFQGKGIGKQLINFAIEKARKQKAKTIEVGTGNSSIGQLLFYQKCGFRITGIDRDFFVKHYREAIYENGIRCRDMIRLSLDL
jgi:Acetyltransferase (GNAT) family.